MFGIDSLSPSPVGERASAAISSQDSMKAENPHHVGYPQTLDQLATIVFDQNSGKVHERFRRGVFAVLLVLEPNFDLSPMSSAKAFTVLKELICTREPLRFACIDEVRTLCLAAIDRSIGAVTDASTPIEQQRADNEKKRAEYYASLDELITLAKPLADTVVARRLIGYARNNGFNPEVEFGEFAVVLREMGGDTLRLVIPTGSDDRFVTTVNAQTQGVWKAIRSPQAEEPQILTQIILGGEKHKSVRSFAHPRKNPITVINSNDPNFSAVVRHETVHAVFGAEAGQCVLADISEGFATFIAKSFDSSSDNLNSVSAIVRSMRGRGLNPRVGNQSVHSHTQLLSESSPHVPIDDHREYSYLYGYCLARALLTSNHYRKSAEIAVLEGKSPYHLAIELNKQLSVDNPHIQALMQVDAGGATIVQATNRELITYALQKTGFNVAEIMEMTNQYLRMALANQNF